MAFDDYIEDDSSQQKQTHITMSNPDHPDTSVGYADEDTVREHFKAANAIQNSPINRNLIVGEFLVALSEAHEQDSLDPLDDFMAEFEDDEDEE